MDVEGLGVTDVVGAPHAIDQLCTGQHASRVAHEKFEEVELLERHRDRLAAHRHHVTVHVHAHRARLDRGRQQLLRLAVSTEHGAHAGEQLTGREWLGDVVVGTDLESHDLVDLAVLRGEHDDRHLRLRPDDATDFEARHPGQHEIEEDQVRATLLEGLERLVSVRGNLDLVALSLQHERQRFRERLLVLHDHDPRHDCASPAGVMMVGSSLSRPRSTTSDSLGEEGT